MDQKGYVMSGLSFLLVLPAILLVAAFVDMTHTGGESVGLVLQSDVTFYAAKDIERNIPTVGTQVLRETADNITATGIPLTNSRTTVKGTMQARMNTIAQNYKNSIGADSVTCTILNVDSSSDPFKVEVNSTVYVKKGNSVHDERVNQDISLTGASIPDPLPFIKLKDYGLPARDNNTGKILYGVALKHYLMSKGIPYETAVVYLDAQSPLFIKQCPYEPYTDHGNETGFPILQSCINNKQFHESQDGACFLCRLEGKSTCAHYGIETFIVPAASTDNSENIFAPVSIDHVLFDTANTYSGKALIYKSGSGDYYKLFLDNGHRQKYGLPTY